MKFNFKEIKKKEKTKLFKKGKKQKTKLPKDVKDLIVLAGGAILLAEAVDILN